MRLSFKLMCIFSAMMLVALLLLSSYASQTNIEGANMYTEARFRNMAASISHDIEQEINMMQLTTEELTGNTTFMAALNQLVRDDSADQKMGNAAANAAVQQLYQSPLVDHYYRVSFYTRSGLFLTSRADRNDTTANYSTKAGRLIGSLSWLDQADAVSTYIVLPPHDDYLSTHQDVPVFGIAQSVSYHGKPIGYLEISKEYADLEHLMSFVDDPSITVRVILDNGEVLFSSINPVPFEQNALEIGSFSTDVMVDGAAYDIFHSVIEPIGIHLYIGQSCQIRELSNAAQSRSLFIRMFLIFLPTLAVIVLISLQLTRSIRCLTKKVQQVPPESLLDHTDTSMLTTHVTSPGDRETYELEQVFNSLMLHLRESTTNELTLREGTLQAQLSALQAQINPHFIYNTLNIISAKSMEMGNFDIIEICDQFAQILRYSMDTRSKTATIAEEIDNVRNYLLLAKARYEESLEFTIDIPENLSDISVPKLTLQPIVENALNHGFDVTTVHCKLSVTGRMQDNTLILEIRDNGTGFPEDMLQNLRHRIDEIEAGKVSIDAANGHIGLINTCLRLYYYSKGKMHVHIRNDNGAVITMTLPCNAGE